MYNTARYLLAGDKGLVVEFGNEISEECNDRVWNMTYALQAEKIEGIVEVISSYRSVLINYDPLVISLEALKYSLRTIESNLDRGQLREKCVFQLPAIYGGEYGPDLEFVASYNNLSLKEVIEIHAGRLYRIYMLGFTVGFPYLGGMSDKIYTPRLKKPRLQIPPGSIGIADKQTGIYPVESPGGWRIIGRTPVKLYSPLKENPFLLEPGNYIEFIPVDKHEYCEIRRQTDKGEYSVITYHLDRRGG